MISFSGHVPVSWCFPSPCQSCSPKKVGINLRPIWQPIIFTTLTTDRKKKKKKTRKCITENTPGWLLQWRLCQRCEGGSFFFQNGSIGFPKTRAMTGDFHFYMIYMFLFFFWSSSMSPVWSTVGLTSHSSFATLVWCVSLPFFSSYFILK